MITEAQVEEKWKTMRMTGAESERCDSYTTPIFRQTKNGAEMIILGGTHLDAYDPQSGYRLWFFTEVGGNRNVTDPVVDGDMVYATAGMRGPVLAINVDGEHKLSEGSVIWKHTRGTPDSSCPVVLDGMLFFISNKGIFWCLDSNTGKVHWSERLEGTYRASPVVSGGRIYLLNTGGLCTVVAASTEFKKLAESKLDDMFIASPAISNGRIYLRGQKTLYCIGAAE